MRKVDNMEKRSVSGNMIGVQRVTGGSPLLAQEILDTMAGPS